MKLSPNTKALPLKPLVKKYHAISKRNRNGVIKTVFVPYQLQELAKEKGASLAVLEDNALAVIAPSGVYVCNPETTLGADTTHYKKLEWECSEWALNIRELSFQA